MDRYSPAFSYFFYCIAINVNVFNWGFNGIDHKVVHNTDRKSITLKKYEKVFVSLMFKKNNKKKTV